MSLTLFRKKDFAGMSHPVTTSHGNLRATPVGYRTRSLTMTSEDDRALLFSRKMYRGKVAFAGGTQEVPRSADAFFRPLRAVRIDPFTLYLNVNVVCSGRIFPGSWTGAGDALASIDAALDWANRVWARGLLWLERRHTEVRDLPRRFEVRWPASRFPMEWKRPGMIDVVVVHRIGRGGAVSRRMPALRGHTIVIGRTLRRGEIRDQLMGHALSHEVGHYLGLEHRSCRNDPRNLMFPGKPLSLDPANLRLLPGQIQRVHRVLAASRGRSADRHN